MGYSPITMVVGKYIGDETNHVIGEIRNFKITDNGKRVIYWN